MRGRAWRASLPAGYSLSLLGVIAFAAGGVADMVWHALLGIEAGVEALVSPTHLLLVFGAALIYTGPIRSAWRRPAGGERRWLTQLPMVVCFGLLLSLLTFFTIYAHPLGRPLAASGNQPTSRLFALRAPDPTIRGDSPTSAFGPVTPSVWPGICSKQHS